MLSRSYVGKRIQVRIKNPKVPFETQHTYKEKYTHIVGKCVMSGFNEIPKVWEVVIDRTPIWPITDNDIIVL